MNIPVQVIDTPPQAIEVTTLWTIFNEPPLEPTIWAYLANNN